MRLPRIPLEVYVAIFGLLALTGWLAQVNTSRQLERALIELSAAKAEAAEASGRAVRAQELAAAAAIEAAGASARAAELEASALKAQRRAQKALQQLAALTPAPDTCQPYIVALAAAEEAQRARGDSLQVAVDTLQFAVDTLGLAVDSLSSSNLALKTSLDRLASAADGVVEATRPSLLARLRPRAYFGIEGGYDLRTGGMFFGPGVALGWEF